MQIKTVSVKNFGPLKNVTIPCDPLTVLVGQNGVGKSTLLRALYVFYNTAINVDERDFFNGEYDGEDNAISITVKYTKLTDVEKGLFKSYIKGDELSVEKRISFKQGKIQQTYHGTRFVNAEFATFRSAKGVDMRKEYNVFKDKYGLPDYTNREEAESTLITWELENKEACQETPDSGQFFGFKNVGTHRLDKNTKYIFIPAVHEASSEGYEEKGSSISEIMELVVRGSLATDPELMKIEEEAVQKYGAFIKRAKVEKLGQISKNLTRSLNSYFPDTQVDIDWIEEQGVTINPPRAFIEVTEEGYKNTIDRCGHGLQRAFILTMFQQLAIIQATQSLQEETESEGPDVAGKKNLPGLIIGIEEPELFQHPDRQRHLSNTLLQLTEKGIEGVGDIQVIYTTHSPLMVDYQRFDQLRIFRKKKVMAEKPKQTQVTSTTLADTASFLEKVKGLTPQSITEEALRQRLISLMTPWMNEGFFAKLVVLVEGINDRALITGYGLSKNTFFERLGISVIPCSGKFSMPEAIAIFKRLQIPLYSVWDSDFNPGTGTGTGKEANHNILRCFECPPEDYPRKITDDYACIHSDLENEFVKEIGEANFSRVLQKYCDDNLLGVGKYVMENPLHVNSLLSIFEKDGLKSPLLTSIYEKIIKKYSLVTKL